MTCDSSPNVPSRKYLSHFPTEKPTITFLHMLFRFNELDTFSLPALYHRYKINSSQILMSEFDYSTTSVLRDVVNNSSMAIHYSEVNGFVHVTFQIEFEMSGSGVRENFYGKPIQSAVPILRFFKN